MRRDFLRQLQQGAARSEHQAQEFGDEARGFFQVFLLSNAIIDGLGEEESAGDGELSSVLLCRHQLLNLFHGSVRVVNNNRELEL
ncbi:hypothetical protein D3C86_1175670 [compost metagenome]